MARGSTARLRTQDVPSNVTPPSQLRLVWSQPSTDVPFTRNSRVAFNRGYRFILFGRYEKALSAFRKAAELNPDFAEAHSAIGWTLAETGHLQDAIAAYDKLVDRFGTANELTLREQVARALYNKGIMLGALNRSADEIAVYDKLVDRFGTANELTLRELIAQALINKGIRLGTLSRSTDEIDVYDELLNRCGAATELALREQVAKALVNKGVALGVLDRTTEAIATYDNLMDRFGTATELALREPVANALVNKGAALGTLDRSADAIATYDKLLDRFGTATEPVLREQVAKALYNKGVTLGALNQFSDAIKLLQEAGKFEWSSEHQHQIAKVMKTLVNNNQGKESLLVSLNTNYTDLNEAGNMPPAEAGRERHDLSTVIMDKATAYEIVAADNELSSVAELHEAIGYWKAAKKEHTKRRTREGAKAEPRAELGSAAQIFTEAAAKSSRRNIRHVFTEAELRDPEAINRARDTLSDIEIARNNGRKISDEQRQAGNRAKAFIRKLSQHTPA